MSKKGKQRRSSEQRIARRLQRSARGAGIFRYLTPEQAASPEFNQSGDEVSETGSVPAPQQPQPNRKSRANNRAEARAEVRGRL